METDRRPQPEHTRKSYNLHPLSGVAILGFDYLFWVLLLVTGPLAIVMAFVFSFVAVLSVEKYMSKRKTWHCVALAGVAAVVVAAPTPVAGTVVGTAILLDSGMGWLARLPGRR